MNLSLRRVVVPALMAASLLGSAAVLQLGFKPASAPPSAVHLSPTRGSCPTGTTLVTASRLPHAPSNCEPLNQPETFADLQALNDSVASRSAAPFSSVQPGAYSAAVAQRDAMRSSAFAGNGGAWSPYGQTPQCADPSTAAGGPCPAAGPDNGNYAYMKGLGFVTLSGRISSFSYDPSTAGRFFASPTAGGVFESLDGGKTWHSVGDGLPTQVVGAIAYDVPLHRLLVGSGDNSFGGSGISGEGFFTSSDDGATWSTSTGFPNLALSFKVVVSPADAVTGNTVYVASSKGLFKSTDGGASFVNEALPTSPTGYSPNCAGDTTTPLCFFANDVTDVVVKGTTTTNAPAGAVMAVVGWRAGERIDTNPDGTNTAGCTLNGTATPCLQAPQNGLYISTTGAPGSFKFQDQGQTASPTNTNPQGTTQGFAPDTVVGRTALGIAHGTNQDNDAVYALVQDAVKFQGCPDALDTGITSGSACNGTATGLSVATYLDGMYATYDFGKSWTKILDYTQTKYTGTNSALVGQVGYSPGIQSWYNLVVEPDPSVSDSNGDPVRVTFGLEEIWENNQSLTPPTAGAANPVLHQPWQTFQTQSAATDPWVVIGRYWNACAALNSGVPCNGNIQSNPVPGTTTHPDQHAQMFVPDGAGGVTLFAGSDGGVFTQHVAKGVDFTNDSWGDGNNLGLNTQQPYDAEMAKDGTVVAGLQDNGEDKITAAGQQAEIFGGDGFFTTIDPNNSQNIIEEYTYGYPYLSDDGGTSWFAIPPVNCNQGPSTNLFANPIEQDPTMPGHIVVGCTQIQEATNAYANPCTAPPGAPSATCGANGQPFSTVFDLGLAPSGKTNNIPSAVGVQGANIYVGYCGYCDVVVGGLPFQSGIATNVGGTVPPAIGTGNGWHFAAGNCSNCGTPDGKLPQRYINSVQMDPTDANTVYVTMGGYGRRWIPPGALGDDVSHVGVGHLFVSHDAGNTFTNISGNLPDAPADWSLIHNGQLVVATDLGVFESADKNGGTFAVLGSGLPTVPVFTIRLSPSNPNLMIAATYGRGVYQYTFPGTPVFLPSHYVSLAPSRILDTRLSTKGSCSVAGTTHACNTLGAGQSLDVQVTGANDVNTGATSGIPTDGTVTAVVLNATVTDTTAQSFLTVWPKGTTRPIASNLNFVPGQVVANLVQVPVSTDGKVSLYNLTGSTDVVLDVAGYYTSNGSGSAGLFRPVAPARVMDTRLGSTGCGGTCKTLGPDSTLTLKVAGTTDITTGKPTGIPFDGTADSVVLNVTVTNPSASGFLTVYPDGSTQPVASNVNFVPGLTVPNRAIVKLGAPGTITIYNKVGTVDVVVDVAGYYTTATATGGNGVYTPVQPARILDTRGQQGSCAGSCATIPANSALTLNVAGSSDINTGAVSGVPTMTAATPPSAVALNVTAVNPSSASFLTIYPNSPLPVISDLNMTPGVVVPNQVVVKLNPNGTITIYNQSGSVDVVVDVEGWYS